VGVRRVREDVAVTFGGAFGRLDLEGGEGEPKGSSSLLGGISLEVLWGFHLKKAFTPEECTLGFVYEVLGSFYLTILLSLIRLFIYFSFHYLLKFIIYLIKKYLLSLYIILEF
jgi:hypothetical protein